MALADLMKEFGQAMGLGDVALEEDGGARIVIDGSLEVDIAAARDGVGFDITAAVCPIPTRNQRGIFAGMLEANLVGQGTGGAALSLDTSLGEVVLSRSIRQDSLSYDEFEGEMIRFTTALRDWRGAFEVEKTKPRPVKAARNRKGKVSYGPN